MDGEVDLVGDQRVTQRGHEDTHAELGDRRRGAVAGCDDPDKLHRATGGGGQSVGDHLRLGERQRAPPGAETKWCGHAFPPISGTAFA